MSHARDDKLTRPMNGQDWLAERFEEDCARLRTVTYRMLGSLSAADEARTPSRQW